MRPIRNRRHIVVDSDDDIDDFPSLQREPPPSSAAVRSPGPEQQVTEAGVVGAASNKVRRRKLGALNNDAGLLQPWRDGTDRSADAPNVGLPHSVERRTGRPKLRVELRVRKSRRVSEQPADDEGELSTEEASMLEDLAVDEDEGNFSGDDKAASDGDSNGSGSDSDASEFQDSTESDFSLGSLDDYFSQPAPPRGAGAAKAAVAPKASRAAASRPRRFPSPETDEGSSLFFSAAESFPDPLSEPLSHLKLDPPRARASPTRSPPAKPSPPARTSRPVTPPLRPPSPLPTRTPAGGLVSPTKKLPRIPQTPHRPSTDAFWDQVVVDDWNAEHSPRKLLFDPAGMKKNQGAGSAVATPAASSPRKGGTAAAGRTAAQERETKKRFQASKHALAEAFLAELDGSITAGELGRLAAATGGVRIEWTNKLNTTAGRANWRRETLRPKQAVSETPAAVPGTPAAATRILHHASIELAEKVIDNEHRLLNVLAHEFCHLANFMVSGITGNPHGKEFKAWAAQCSRHFADRGIQVTTKHTYEIDFKYVWVCAACATEFKRHSKSIDPARHRCGACKGMLQQTKPVPRRAAGSGGSGSGATDGTGNARGSTATPAPSAYQQFIKEHMAAVRRENPGSPQKEIMKLVASKWTQAKAEKTTACADRLDRLDQAFVDLTLE